MIIDSADRVDLGEPLLLKDSWEIELDADEYEVEEISDDRSGRKNRYVRIHRQYMVRWKDHNDLTWTDGADRNCGSLL